MINSELESILSDLIRSISCAICLGRAVLPNQLRCSHIFCNKCIREALRSNAVCPLCFSTATEKDLSSSAFFTSLIDSVSNLIDTIDPSRRTPEKVIILPFVPITSKPKVATAQTLTSDVTDMPISSPVSDVFVPVPIPDSVQVSAQVTTIITDTGYDRPVIPPQPRKLFNPKQVVHVLPRTWPGINKEGGTAWVTARHDSEDGDVEKTTYDVKYIVTSKRESHVSCVFVQEAEELQLERGQRARQRPCVQEFICSSRSFASSSSLLCASHASELTSEHEANHRSSDITSSSSSRKRQRIERVRGKDGSTSVSSLSSMRGGASASLSMQTLVLLHTALSVEDKAFLCTFVETVRSKQTLPTVSVRVEEQFSTGITHVVVTVNAHATVELRTIKYLQALIAGKWIVSCQWLRDSLSVGRLLPESKYEVVKDRKAELSHAPRRARTKREQGAHGLFHGLLVLFLGPFPSPGPPRSSLEALLQAGGGRVLTQSTQLWRALRLLLRVTLLDTAPSHTSISNEAEAMAEAVSVSVGVGTVVDTSTRHGYEGVVKVVVVSSDEEEIAQFRFELEAFRRCVTDERAATSTGSSSSDGDEMSVLSIDVHPPVWLMDCISNYSLLPV